MITRESVKAEIDWAGEQYLEVLYKFIKTLQSSNRDHKSLMSKLKTVEIHALSDFAQNIDAYLDGEKHVE